MAPGRDAGEQEEEVVEALFDAISAEWSASPLADVPLATAIGDLGLPAGQLLAIDYTLRRMSPRGRIGPMTVGQFLLDRAAQREIAYRAPLAPLARAIGRWFQKQRERLPAGNLADAGVPASRRADLPPRREVSLRQKVRAAAVPDLEAWPLALLGAADSSLHLRLSSITLLEERRTDAARLHAEQARLAGRPDAVEQAHALLDTFLAALQERRAALPRLPGAVERTGPTVDDPLDRLQLALEESRRPTREAWPPGLLAPRTTASNDRRGGASRVQLTLQFAGVAEVVCVDTPDLAGWTGWAPLSCSCSRPACVHRALALDWLLGAFGDPPSAARAVLEAGLQPLWRDALDRFLTDEPEAPDRGDSPAALSFQLGPHGCHPHLHPIGKRGRSKSGRRISRVGEVLRRLSGQDLRVAELLALAEAESPSDPSSSPFAGDALLALAGHPEVVWADGEPVPVEVGDARVATRSQDEEDGSLLFQVLAGAEPVRADRVLRCSSGFVTVVREKDRALLVRVPETLLRFTEAIAATQGRFPREALPSLLPALSRLESVAVVELPEELRGEERPSASRAAVRVAQAGTGLQLSLRIEPLAGGPLFAPGQGVPMAVALEGQRRVFARRDLERELAEAVRVAGLLGLDPAAGEPPYVFDLEPGDRSVETLRRLSGLAEGGLQVEWKAPKPRFTSEARLDRLRLKVERGRDWFGLDGAVQVDDRRVALAALLEAARQRRRWVRLAEGDFAQLSEQLVERLAPLAHLAEEGKGATLTLGAAPLLEALAPLVEELQAEEGWRALTERLRGATALEVEPPEELRPVLRDYQAEGFRWLSRLAAWGAGACLADDMGLGKTLQALALLVARAGSGPALVVAPASVLFGWRSEAARFAPALRVHLFHEGDRDLGGVGPGDLVVVSWSLLAREAELFAATRFATVVLDEAQVMKNAATLRAKAAHGLQAGFVVALSGTPIENHLGELWSLFRAVLPSLLGSEQSFKRRFGQGADSARALAAICQPFILRRTKSEVARELPPRTEVDLLVPLSPEERALYDDVRLAATASLGELTADDQRFQVLAALTRLRLAACHPKLVQPGWTGPASKLARVLELVRDLAAAGHKALVFSQFTQHLGLVAEALRAEGIPFSSLDGQVPLAERQRRVEAFQAGAGGDLFLISLKAGGTGLTLTAANYVLHLDPWWNPAVEDQASDRAHRIGQQKPVTVYRLIVEASIEQQILSLHREKRELVDAFLSGADRAGKLNTQELAQLIRGA